jgi:hypothetical protein
MTGCTMIPRQRLLQFSGMYIRSMDQANEKLPAITKRFGGFGANFSYPLINAKRMAGPYS